VDFSSEPGQWENGSASGRPEYRLRAERKRRQMTLRQLAERTGLTPSHLSKIERGLANPTVGTLTRIGNELGVNLLDSFLQTPSPDIVPPRTWSGMPSGEDPARPQFRSPILRPDLRKSYRVNGVEFQRLTPSQDVIDFIEVRYEVGAGDTEMYRHSGREYGLVIQGRLQIEYAFETYVLEPGWSHVFDSSVPHRYLNIGDEPAIIVAVSLP
jgi:transcriptional regulator with XRE-family HTH domain